MDNQLSFTLHAEERCVQRNIYFEEVSYAVRHGRRCRTAGMLTFFLGWRDIPYEDRANQRIAQLEGLTVQTAPGGDGTLLVITAYRNKDGYKGQNRKPKFDCHRQRH